MIINLVSRDNGVGLSQDMALLEEVFRPAGHKVVRVPWRQRSMNPCQVAIFLELFNPALARYARHTVGIFNMEWFEDRWRAHLPRFRQLWAKSDETEKTLRQWGLRNVHHTGFASRDMHDLAVDRQLHCLHLAGHSSLKGTEAVLEAWRHNPDLPPLTVVSANTYPVPPGVRLLGRLSHHQLVVEMNNAVIHVCPSRAEGWGHYIAEGMSTGAVVVTTDASPMNEHVRPEHGVLVPVAESGRRHHAADHRVDADAIASAVRYAATLPHDQRTAMGHAARDHMLARNERFRQTALDLLQRMR